MYKDGFAADPTLRRGVGSQRGSSALLSIEQVETVIKALKDAIDVVEKASS